MMFFFKSQGRIFAKTRKILSLLTQTIKIMKKLFTLSLFVLGVVLVSHAQVGVGTPLPNASSQLDVVANDKGTLIPRLSLTGSTDATTIVNGNVTSLLVYNTATVADIVPGYHYWDGTKWVRLAITDDITVLETVTTLTNNGDGTLTYTDEDGVDTIINTTVLSTNTQITDGTIDIDGDGTPDTNVTLQDIVDNINTIIDANETLTTLTDNGDGTLTYVDEDGASTIIDIANLETTTTLADNGDGTLTYTDEDGVDTIINTTVLSTNTQITDGTVDIDGDGTPDTNVTLKDIVDNINTIIDANETLTTLTDNGDGTLTYVDEDGASTIIDIANLETTTTLADNGDGTLTYTDEDGVDTIINTTVLSTNTQITDGTVDIDGDGTPDTNVTLQDIVDNIGTIVSAQETVTTFNDNGDGTYTYTSEDGTVTTTAAPGAETVTTLVNNGDGTFTYTSENGTVTAFDADGDLVDNGNGTFTYTNAAGVATIIDITNSTLTQAVGNTDTEVTAGTARTIATHDDGTGTNVNVNETVTSLTDNGDGTLTYVNEDRTPKIIDIANLETTTTLGITAGELVYANEDASNPNVPLISADANNAIIAGTDDALFVTANNGLNVDGASSAIQLGGTLTETTTITTDATNTLAIEGLQTGTVADNIVLADPTTGVLKSISQSTLVLEPWFGEDDNAAATLNTENIYHMGNIGIKTATPAGALDVEGGNVKFGNYPNTRDDSGTTLVANILYTDGSGNVLSAPAESATTGGGTNGTATAGTDYVYVDANLPSTVYKIFVYRNGVKLLAGVDYSLTAVGEVTVLSSNGVGVEAYSFATGDRIEIQWFK